MNAKELREKSNKELQTMARQLKEKEQGLRFQLAAGKVKNVREIRLVKKNIAQVLTIVKEKQVDPLFEKKVSNRQKIQSVARAK